MSLVATVKLVNLGYYGSFSVGMLCGAHFMFGEDSPMMMSYWKSSNITGAGAEATNWGFRLVACVTLPWLAGPALGCPDETYLLQSLLVSFGVGVLQLQSLFGLSDDAVNSKPLWYMNLANQAAVALLTYAAYRQVKGK